MGSLNKIFSKLIKRLTSKITLPDDFESIGIRKGGIPLTRCDHSNFLLILRIANHYVSFLLREFIPYQPQIPYPPIGQSLAPDYRLILIKSHDAH